MQHPTVLDVNYERLALPSINAKNVGFSLWSVFKDLLGKDITRISMPVNINEPMSQLQKIAEFCMFNHFLEQASKEPNSLKRLGLVACYSSLRAILCVNRVRKPFNALLGGIFELVTPSYRMLAEQVSQHPPISAIYLQGDGYGF